jgi:hypothetical protein
VADYRKGDFGFLVERTVSLMLDVLILAMLYLIAIKVIKNLSSLFGIITI